MSSIDWKSLSPDTPVPRGGEAYVPRRRGGDRIATLLGHGLGPLAVTGPPGVGKSTELNRAGEALEPEVLAVSLAVDDIARAARHDPRDLLFDVTEGVLERVIVREPDFQPSEALVKDVHASDPVFPRGHGKRRALPELAAAVLGEVRLFLGRPLALLLDGLDEWPAAEASRALLSLVRVREQVRLAAAVSPAVVTGPASHDVVDRLRVFAVPVRPVREEEGMAWEEGRAFLREILARHLGVEDLPGELDEVLEAAAAWSGGLPRTWLHLLQDAGLFADLAGREHPDGDDLVQAVRDQVDGLRRVLREGDLAALVAADGTSGLEVETGRRVRFLGQGLLLEYARGAETVVHPSPLLDPLLREVRGGGRGPRKE